MCTYVPFSDIMIVGHQILETKLYRNPGDPGAVAFRVQLFPNTTVSKERRLTNLVSRRRHMST